MADVVGVVDAVVVEVVVVVAVAARNDDYDRQYKSKRNIEHFIVCSWLLIARF